MEPQLSLSPILPKDRSRRKDLIIWWSIAGGFLALYFLIGILEVNVIYLPYGDQLSMVLFGSGVIIAIIAFIKTLLAVSMKGKILAATIACVAIGAASVYVIYFLQAEKEMRKNFEQAIQEQLEQGEIAVGRKIYRNDIAGLEFQYPASWPEPKSPPGRVPFNLPEYAMQYGNPFFVSLIDDAYIDFKYTGNYQPVTLEETLQRFYPEGNILTSTNGVRYLLYIANTERNGPMVFVNLEPKNEYEVAFIISASQYQKQTKEYSELFSTLKFTR